MAHTSVDQARAFVQSAQLPAPPAAARGAVKTEPPDFDAAKDQSAVVGSEVLSFVEGVTAEQRTDVCNAVLLAQLIAKRKVPSPRTEADLRSWYESYFDTLSNLGFAVQAREFVRYEEKGRSFEVHEAILEVASTLLAGSPAALALVVTTLKALRKMSEDSPWITLFDRESQSANTARFQISAVENDGPRGFLLSTMAFGLDARSEVTQVLFFKYHSNDVTLFHQDGRISINEQVLASVREPIATRLAAFASDFIKTLPEDLQVPEPAAGGVTGGGR